MPRTSRRRAATCGWPSPSRADEIAELEASRPPPGRQARAAQRRLAAELTALVHGQRPSSQRVVELASQALFGRGELAELDEAHAGQAALAEIPSASS